MLQKVICLGIDGACPAAVLGTAPCRQCRRLAFPPSAAGIDWYAVVEALFVADGPDALTAYHALGRLADLAPSKRWYTPAMVGQDVGSGDVARDLEFVRRLRCEARVLGLAIETDEMGEMLYARAGFTRCLALPGGVCLLPDGEDGPQA